MSRTAVAATYDVSTTMRDLVIAFVAWLEEMGAAGAERLGPVRSASQAPEYLSTKAAGKLADVAPATIRRWIREGKLKPYSAGRHVRVIRTDLETLLKNGKRKAITASPKELARQAFGDFR